MATDVTGQKPPLDRYPRNGLMGIRRPKPVLPLIAFALLLTAWGIFCLGAHQASLLDLSQFGPCEDVCESLGRDGYVARFQLPYFTGAVVFDCLAVIARVAAGVARQFRVLGVLAAVLCVPTVALHGLGLFVLFMFAF
jgi:hypothetical protein